MSDKAIIVTDMPESCSKCKFMYEFYGIKKCQLLNVLKNGGKAIICVDKLNVARKECCPLVSKEFYDKEIRDKAIDELKEMVEGHKYVNAEDGTTVEEMLRNEETEKKYAWYLSRNQCCDWMLHRIDEIAEQMKEVEK